MIKYSFVIPTYNNKKLLRNSLVALNYQEGFGKDDYEVIVVDDGSTDNTKEYIEGVNERYNIKYIYIERDENSCRSKARNVGWQAAEGEIIVFIDSDIIVRSDYLKEAERFLSKDLNIILFGTRFMLQEDVTEQSIIDKSIYNKDYYHTNNMNCLEDRHFILNQFSFNASIHPFSWDLVYTCNIVLSKALIKDLGGFDTNFKGWGGEDVELGYRAYVSGVNIICNNKLEVLHQYHVSSFNSNIEGKIENAKYFYKIHPEALNFLPDEIRIRILTGGEGNEDEKKLWKEREAHLGRLYDEMNKRVGIEKEVVINFREEGELDNIKKEIESYENKEDTMLIVNDYVEDCNLDVWIQLLDDLKYRIKYYPVSKKLTEHEFNIDNI